MSNKIIDLLNEKINYCHTFYVLIYGLLVVFYVIFDRSNKNKIYKMIFIGTKKIIYNSDVYRQIVTIHWLSKQILFSKYNLYKHLKIILL